MKCFIFVAAFCGSLLLAISMFHNVTCAYQQVIEPPISLGMACGVGMGLGQGYYGVTPIFVVREAISGETA